MYKMGALFGMGCGLLYTQQKINPIEFWFWNKTAEKESNESTKTYIWGNGAYQAKPGKALQFHNFEPKLIKNFLGAEFPNMSQIKFGQFCEAGLDMNGNVYVWNKKIQPSSKEVQTDYNLRDNIIKVDDSSDFVQIEITRDFLWGLRKNGKVCQWGLLKDKDGLNSVKPVRNIDSLENISHLSAGKDHLVMLDKNGEVYTMGDDTLGQCGTGPDGRTTGGPFYETRNKNPRKIPNLPKISKIRTGGYHTLVVAESGEVFGWGSNSKCQLSHEKEFAQQDQPLQVSFMPLRIDTGMSHLMIEDCAAGNEFSIFVGKNRFNEETEVFGAGHNLKGELGAGFLRHITDVVKIDPLSNLIMKTEEGEQKIRINQLECGDYHCMAKLNVGALLEWGSNDEGQLGNRKRTFSENPIWIKTFQKENVKNICCGYTSSAVICENRDVENKGAEELKNGTKKDQKVKN